jgi:hypothetical protein
MANLEQFSRHMVVRADRLPIKAAELQREVAMTVHENLVYGTPVDTGLARSNWLMSIGKSRTDVIPQYSYGNFLGISETKNAVQAITQAITALQSHKPGQDIYDTNNVHYIETLGRGHSRQASAGWIPLAIQAGLEAVRTKRLLGP